MNGAPVYSLDANLVSNISGATYLGNYVNSGDFVGNGLGATNGWSEFLKSTALIPLLFSDTKSPHSSYYCQGSLCSYNKLNQAH